MPTDPAARATIADRVRPAARFAVAGRWLDVRSPAGTSDGGDRAHVPDGVRRRSWPRRGALVGVVLGLVLSGCADDPGTTGDDGEATAAAVPAPSDIRGGEGACTDALRSGPLIDPEDSALGEPAPGVEPLPVVDLPRLDTCELSSTADWLGGPLVVNFWASWCGPCREEMPTLDEWAAERADEVDLVGVTVDFRQQDAEEFLAEVPVDFPSWFDPDAQVLADQVSVRSMPTTLFVDADGSIVHRHVGPITLDQLDAAASEHLGV